MGLLALRARIRLVFDRVLGTELDRLDRLLQALDLLERVALGFLGEAFILVDGLIEHLVEVSLILVHRFAIIARRLGTVECSDENDARLEVGQVE